MRAFASAAAVIAAAALAAGCGGSGKSQPAFGDLVPVAGTVSQGGKAVTGGAVTFTPDPPKDEFLTNSEVGPDGKFSLTTVRLTDSSGERKTGVAPGKYLVTYQPPLGNQAEGGSIDPVELPAPVTIGGPETNMKVDLPARKK